MPSEDPQVVVYHYPFRVLRAWKALCGEYLGERGRLVDAVRRVTCPKCKERLQGLTGVDHKEEAAGLSHEITRVNAPVDAASMALERQLARRAAQLDQRGAAVAVQPEGSAQLDQAVTAVAVQPELGAQLDPADLAARELDHQLLDQLDSQRRERELDKQALHAAGIVGTPQAAGEQRPDQLVYCLPLAGGQRRAQLRLPQPLSGFDIDALEHLFRAVMSVEKLKAEIESTPEGDPHGL